MQRAVVGLRRAAKQSRALARSLAFEVMERRVLLTTFTVTTTADIGAGSLREALADASSPSYPGPNNIDFALPAESSAAVNYDPMYQQWTIDVESALPPITGEVTIDGYSQNILTTESAANEVQSISVTGSPSGGTFTLSFEGQTTAPIDYDATAAQVGAALADLSTIGQSNVIAGGGPVNTNPVSITFTNHLATLDLPLITGDPSGLISSGTTPDVSTLIDTVGFSGEITSAVNQLGIGFNASVRVILEGGNGAQQQAPFDGLMIESPHNIIRGLIIDGFDTGIELEGSAAVGNLIQGDYIGQYVSFLNPILTGPPSTVQGIGNGVGVLISSATNNQVGGVPANTHNALSGNAEQGVNIEAGSNGNQVTGDLIGVLEQDSTTYYQVGNGAEGVLIESSSNLIGGDVTGSTNVISANQSYGIHVEGSGALRNVIESNYIGTDINGTFLFGQGDPGNGQNTPVQTGNLRDGVFIDDAPFNQIGTTGGAEGVGNVGGNVISMNFGAGIRITGLSATGNSVWGNVIGTDVGGTMALPNADAGVHIESADNSVGGVVADAGNLISSNLTGVSLVGDDANDNLVAGNLIGTDGTGSYDLGNATEGVLVDGGADNTVGGTVAAARNVISGNNVGVLIANSSSSVTAVANVIAGNFIGTNEAGALDLGNSQQGILIDSVAANTIGGTATGAGNVISANYWGVVLSGSGATANVLEGNLIGTDATGKLPLGNESDGVLVTDSAASNLIGGMGTGVGNTIAFNIADGIRVEGNDSVSNAILSNSIFSSGDLGINLVSPSDPANEVTPNNPPGTATATGPNNLLNFPILTAVESTSDGVDVSGSYSGAPNSTYAIQFFSSPTANPSGYGEGETYLATVSVTTAANGVGYFTAEIPVYVAAGQFVTATATDAINDTSEFSAWITEAVGSLQFAMTSFLTSEGAGTATITVTRAGGSGGFATVDYVISNGTAIYGTDYDQPAGTTAITPPDNQPVSSFIGTLVFNAQQYSETFSIPLIDNGLPGANKTLNLALESPTGAATVGTPATATLTIINDNLPGAFQFSMANYVVNESQGSIAITVLRGNPGTPVTVNYATGGGTAVPNVRYLPVSGTLVFAQGVITQTFSVPIIDLPGIQGDQTVGLFLSSPTGGATLGAPSTATLTIQDDLVDHSGPTVKSIRFRPSGAGAITKLVVAFDKPLNPSTAVNLVNYAYSVQTAGANQQFGTDGGLVIPITSAVYSAAHRTVTLTLLRGIGRRTPFLFTINQSTSVGGAGVGVAGRSGNLLDGNYSGIAGTPFSAVLKGKTGFNAPTHAVQVDLVAIRRTTRPPHHNRVRALPWRDRSLAPRPGHDERRT